MRIVLQHLNERVDVEKGQLDEEFALDNTAFDVPGWIGVEVGGVEVAEIHIKDLYPAVVALREQYEEQTRSDRRGE